MGVLALLLLIAPPAAHVTLPTPWMAGDAWTVRIRRESTIDSAGPRGSAQDATVELAIEQRDAEGFVATWTPLAAEGDATRRFLRLRLDGSGRVKSLLNRRDVQRDVAGLIDKTFDAMPETLRRTLSTMRVSMRDEVVESLLREPTLFFSWCGETLTAGQSAHEGRIRDRPDEMGLPGDWAVLVESAPERWTVTREGRADEKAVAAWKRRWESVGAPAGRVAGMAPPPAPRPVRSGEAAPMPGAAPSLQDAPTPWMPRGLVAEIEIRETFVMDAATGMPDTITREVVRLTRGFQGTERVTMTAWRMDRAGAGAGE